MPGSPPPCHHAGGDGPWNSRPCDCARPVEAFTCKPGFEYWLQCVDCGYQLPTVNQDPDDPCESCAGRMVVHSQPAAAPSCADLDLEPLASPRAARLAYAAVIAARKLQPPARACARGCGQTMINDHAQETVCVTCRRAEHAHQGEAMRLFTPAPAQISGQEGLFT